jgi:CTP synthase (UTP-ammonia lyase)
VLGFTDAQHEEYDPPAGSRLLLARLVCTVAGKELPITLAEDSLAAKAYGRTKIFEHYYCSFGLNPEYRERLGTLRVTGWDDANEARVIELPGEAFSLATLFVPRSTPDSPHPLALAFLQSAHDRARIVQSARSI